jgi:hypothetical protein
MPKASMDENGSTVLWKDYEEGLVLQSNNKTPWLREC